MAVRIHFYSAVRRRFCAEGSLQGATAARNSRAFRPAHDDQPVQGSRFVAQGQNRRRCRVVKTRSRSMPEAAIAAPQRPESAELARRWREGRRAQPTSRSTTPRPVWLPPEGAVPLQARGTRYRMAGGRATPPSLLYRPEAGALHVSPRPGRQHEPQGQLLGHSIYDRPERCFRPDPSWDWWNASALTCRLDAVLTSEMPSLLRVT